MLGGLGAIAVARSAWVIVREQGTQTRWMLPLKQNLHASTAGLAFVISANAEGHPRVQWLESSAEHSCGGNLAADPATLTVEALQAELAALARPSPAAVEETARQELAALVARLGGPLKKARLDQ
ncbi:MAG: hypothetical protein HY000_41570 [Planctomycetes bacterium]|nr:hypothetical protein [Planctomycetota bacterium]